MSTDRTNTDPAQNGRAADTDMAQTPPPESIRDAQARFVEVWGRMGSAWGISRTMAEVHALLFITGRDLCTDDVMDRLNVSRGNASMTLRALTEWGIVQRVHKRGDRKEYFRAEQDVWTMFKTIASERKKRELDPVVASIYEIRDGTRAERGDAAEAHNRRLDDMLDAMETFDTLSSSLLDGKGKGLKLALGLLAKASPKR